MADHDSNASLPNKLSMQLLLPLQQALVAGHDNGGQLTMKAISAKQALMMWPRSIEAEHPRIHLHWHQASSSKVEQSDQERARHKSTGSNNMQ